MSEQVLGTNPTTLYTFGDSILDCGRYNPHGITPAGLLIKNDDGLFPEFRGRELAARGTVQLEHRAVDGARVGHLALQVQGLKVNEPAIAMVTIGGNDLLAGLAADPGPGIDAFALALERFAASLPIRPLLLGNVYDPTMGDDARNFLGIDPRLARASLRRMNDAIAAVASRHGRLVDLHAHFLTGDPSWFTQIIEPSLRGASEVRRCFLEAIESLSASAGDSWGLRCMTRWRSLSVGPWRAIRQSDRPWIPAPRDYPLGLGSADLRLPSTCRGPLAWPTSSEVFDNLVHRSARSIQESSQDLVPGGSLHPRLKSQAHRSTRLR